MKTDINWKAVILIVLVIVFLLAIEGISRKAEEKRENAVPVALEEVSPDKKENEETARDMTKQQIRELKNEAEDNIDLPDSDMEISFFGYEENPDAFSWLAASDWEVFQEKLKGYLKKKNLEVTQVNLHPDSIQQINDYERYVYLDVDYQTAYSNQILIKAICDTYKDTMRFAFEIQYGD